VRLFFVVIWLGLGGSVAPLYGCEVALVLAIDVSRSVGPGEFQLIRHGTARAFRQPEIAELIGWMPGGIAVTATEWSGPSHQKQMITWRHLTDLESITEFADALDTMARAYRYDLTSPAEALVQADSLFASVPVDCRRHVIDMAGDGVRNIGLNTGKTADAIFAKGITINGLVVRGDTPDPLEFYKTQIKRGPLSFVLIADGYDDFPRAILRKLLRELTPSLSLATP